MAVKQLDFSTNHIIGRVFQARDISKRHRRLKQHWGSLSCDRMHNVIIDLVVMAHSRKQLKGLKKNKDNGVYQGDNLNYNVVDSLHLPEFCVLMVEIASRYIKYLHSFEKNKKI